MIFIDMDPEGGQVCGMDIGINDMGIYMDALVQVLIRLLSFAQRLVLFVAPAHIAEGG